MTETEMKQGLDYFTSTADQGIIYMYMYICETILIDITAGRPCDIDIYRGNEPLGIAISGGIGSYQVSIFQYTLVYLLYFFFRMVYIFRR